MKRILQWMFLLVLMSAIGTIQAQEPLNYFCDFENDADTAGWVLSNPNAVNQWCIGTAANHTPNGTKSMYISNDNGVSHAYGDGTTFACVYREVSLVAGTYDFSFDWMSVGETGWYGIYYDYFRVMLVPSTVTIPTEVPSYDFYNVTPSGWIALDDNGVLYSESWQERVMEFDIAVAGDYKLVFCWYNDNSYGYGVPAAIDNVKLKQQTCPKPSQLAISEITSEGATLSWTENGSAALWQVEYGEHGFVRGTGVTFSDVSENPYLLTGLTANTAYDVYVESLCDLNDTSNASMISFRTACGDMELPYFDDFESYDPDIFPYCWTLYEGESKIYNSSWGDAYRGSQSLYMQNNATIVSPQMLIPANEAGIYFAAKRSNVNAGSLEVGFVSDLISWDYIVLRTIDPIDENYHLYEIDFDDLGDLVDYGYIVIRQQYSNSTWDRWYIDDVTIFQLGNCRAPKDFMISNITDHSAMLSWTNISDADVQISYEDHLITVVSGVNTYTLTNLAPNTMYNVKARAKCSAIDTSFWQEAGNFKTEITCAQLLSANVDQITTTSAAVHWHFSENGNVPHSGAFLQYKAEDATDWINLSVDGNGYFLTGLLPAVKYNVMVSTICGTDTSSYEMLNFKTASGVCGEIVGEGNTNETVPLNGYSNYSYSQSLYSSDIIEGMDTIRGVAYHTSGYSQTRMIQMYIGNTTQNDFYDASDYVPLDEMTLVYDTNYTFSGNGWDTIMFTTPLVTNGNNIVICMFDNTGTYESNRVAFYYHQGNSIYKNTDWGGAISPTDYGIYNIPQVADVRFIGECQAPTCKAPIVTCASSDASTITFSWMPGLDETSWTVDYRAMGTEEWTNLSASTTDTFAVLSDLLPGKGYEVRVGSICTDNTLYATAGGYTTCDVFEVPYFEDFESGSLCACWRLGTVRAYGYEPECSEGELYMPANSYVVMSNFDAPVNTLQLVFKMDDMGAKSPLYVGVCNEQNNILSYVPVDTVYVDPLNPNDEIIVRLSSYVGEGQYITLRTGATYVDIDSLNVEAIPSCAKPLHVHVAALGGTSITVAWDNDGTSNAWNAIIVPAGEEVSTGESILVSESTITFSDLTVNTAYDIYISSSCGDENSEEVMITATTLGTDPLMLPYATDFSDATQNTQWTYYQVIGTNKWTIGNATSNGNANALYVSDDNGVTNNYNLNVESISMAFLPITVVEDGVHVLSFDWKGINENSYDFSRVFLLPSSFNFATAPIDRNEYNYNVPSDWIAMDNGLMYGQSEWTHVDKKTTLNVGTYYLAFVWINDYSSGNEPPTAIDNINFVHVACPEPLGVQVTDITSNSATVSWRNDGTVMNGWEITLNGEDPISVTDTFYTFDNLTFGTAYTVGVRSVCDESSRSLYVNTSFYTECSDIDVLPYINNFDLEPANGVPHCWSASGSYPHVTDGSLYFYCNQWDNITDNVISLPRLGDAFEMENLEMTFRVKNNSSYGNNLYVGVSKVEHDLVSFTPVDTIQMTSDWQDCLVSFNNYTDTGRYITFKLNLSSNYYDNTYVDDVVLQVTSPCGRPTSAYVQSYTHNSATIGWIDTNESATFKVALSTTNNVFTAETVVESVPVSPYTFTDLQGSTTYYAWVSADCSDNVSGWVSAGEFTTNPTCGMVTDLNVVDIDESHATITWTNPTIGEPVTNYVVSLKMNNNVPTLDTVQVPYVFLENLSTDSSYTVTVTTLCDTVASESNRISFMPTELPGCNVIGTGVWTESYVPTHTWYAYSLSQILFTADELASMGDTINGITFFRNTYTPYVRDIKVYMGTTDLVQFNSGWIPSENLTLVYDGTWNLNYGDCPIDFTTPYVRNHDQNLVVMIDDNTGIAESSSTFYYTQTDGNMVIYRYDDGENITTNTIGYNTTTYRPNVRFDAICAPITCFPPSIVKTDLNDTAISIVWRAGNDETAWSVEYKAVDEEDWTVFSANTTTKSATITGLYPGTDYIVRVGALCTDNTVYRSLAFSTECGVMPLPFMEDFDFLPIDIFNKRCWTMNGTSYQNMPSVNSVVGNGNMLFLYDQGWVALPEMRGDLSDLQIRLRILAGADTYYTLVGYMTNCNDIASFHVVDTIYDHNNNYGEYHTILFNNIPEGTEGNIALYTPHTLGYTFVDDIIVEPIRSCVEPTDLLATNITTTSADLSWNSSASNYVVEYGETGYKVRHEQGIVTTVTGITTTLNGLTAGTTYDVYVSAICSAGDTSYPSNAYTFTTECTPITDLPYVMNFELNYLPPLTETRMIPNCWTVAYMDSANSQEQYRPQVVFDESHIYSVNGDYALRVSDKGIFALPEMAMDIDTLCVRFYNKVLNPNSRILVGVLDDLYDGCENRFDVVDTIVPTNSNTVEPYVVYFNHYTGLGKYIAFRNINIIDSIDYSTQYFDSIVVDYIPTCAEVLNLEVTAYTGSTITIDWDDISSPADSYEVVYGPLGFSNNGSTGTSVIASGHPYVITGLEMLTEYEIWVRPICGDGDTGFFGYHPVYGKTALCDHPVVYTSAPNGVTGVSDRYPLGAWYGHSYSQTIIDSTYLTEVTDISALQLHETMSSNNKMNGVQVWMTTSTKSSFTDINDGISTSTMTLVYTGNLEYENGFVVIPLLFPYHYDGGNLIISILRNCASYEQGHNFNTVGDSVNKTIYSTVDWEALDPDNLNPDPSKSGVVAAHAAFEFVVCGSGCDTPILTSVTDITFESATINWSNEDSEANFEVAIRAEEDADMSTPVATTGNSYVFNNLTPNTTYTYYLRQVCDEDVYSDWAEGIFTTSDLPCLTPTNVIEVSHTAETITIDWTATEEQTKWAVHTYNTMEDYIDTVTAHPATITGLIGGQTYQVAVQAICATNYVSEWSDPIEITTTDCLPVSDVAVSNITSNSAKVSWTAGGDESLWEINYGDEGFGQGEGAIIESTTNSYTITDLEPESEYDVYVRAKCSEDFTSVWSEVVTFETLEEENPEGIDGVDGNYCLAIYPNPTSGATTIKLNGVEGEVEISIVDMNGRTVTTEIINCGSDCEKRMDVDGLAQGTYFVRVLGDNVNSVRKLIVR